jgi:hypothetical protein
MLALLAGGLVLGFVQSAGATPNPYTPERVCGAGYKQIDRADLRPRGAGVGVGARVRHVPGGATFVAPGR